MSSEYGARPGFVVLDAAGSNWHSWQTTAKFELKAQKVWKFFDPGHPSSSRPEKYSAEDLTKLGKGVDPSELVILSSYTTWEEECDVAIARLARLVDPVHADILDCSSLPKECWDALVVRFANQSTQGVTLIQTKLSALKFSDDDSITLTDFLATFSGLVLDLKRAGHPLTDAETCSRIALAMPLSLQPLVSTLQEGQNAANPGHWCASLSTTWERLKCVRASESTFAAKRAATPSTTRSRDTCHVCHNPGHYARFCPTLSPEEQARRQENHRKRKEGRSRSPNKAGEKTPDIAAQLAQIQAHLAALNTGSHSGDTSSGYDAHAKVSILCASADSLSGRARLACLERDHSGGLILKAGGGKIPANYAAIDSGASRHCASERAFFTNYRTLGEPKRVYLGDDHFIMAVGEGDLRIWVDGPSGEREGIVFTRTLHVPDLACILISIRQLTRDAKPAVHAIFRGNACEIRNDNGLVFRATADDSAGGLYALRLRTAPRPTLRTPVLALAAFVAGKSTAKLDPHVAHARFGHINTNDLNALVRKQLL